MARARFLDKYMSRLAAPVAAGASSIAVVRAPPVLNNGDWYELTLTSITDVNAEIDYATDSVVKVTSVAGTTLTVSGWISNNRPAGYSQNDWCYLSVHAGQMMLKGDTGDTGATGPKGDKGDTGDTGATGAQGATGATGATGAQGIPGPQGEQGLQGIPGPQGDTGATGATGAKGDTGPAGPGLPPGGGVGQVPIKTSVADYDTAWGLVPTLYTANGTLTGNRTVTLGANTLNFAGSTTGDFSVNTNQLLVDTSTGNVGVGTGSPGAKLNLDSGSIRIGSAATYSDYTANSLVRHFDAWTLGSTHYVYKFGYDATLGDYLYLGAPGNQAATTDAAAILSESLGFIVGTGSLDGNALTDTRFVVNSTGNVGVATTSPTAKVDINSNVLRLRTPKTPASASDTGNQGDMCWNTAYHFQAVGSNNWKMSPLIPVGTPVFSGTVTAGQTMTFVNGLLSTVS